MSDCTVNLPGRLGNHMFAIATGLAHAKRNGYRLVLDSRFIRYPQYWTGILANSCRFLNSTAHINGPQWREPSFAYSPIPANALLLHGYLQSAKYFADASGEVRALFQPPLPIQNEVHATHASLLTERHRTVAVHIRRGDYFVGDVNGHGHLTDLYFRRTMDLARIQIPGCQFTIFSDDNDWCKAQSWLQSRDCIFVEESDESKALYLMSLFDGIIMSNSTFSWWAAYLARSRPTFKCWVPDPWFGPLGLQDFQDIYEPSWIKVATT